MAANIKKNINFTASGRVFVDNIGVSVSISVSSVNAFDSVFYSRSL